MRVILSIVLVSVLTIFAWSFVAWASPVAEWSDIRYLLRDMKVSEDTDAAIRQILYQSRRDWLVVRCLSGGIAVVALVGLLLQSKKD
jgi:hypothetical protein